jgi:aryl-alcohol dehydrogenase-like predicted oxidoreductase
MRTVGDLSVYPIGLGAMPLSDPDMVPERERAIATVHAALDAGITLLDSSDIYAPDGARFGHNEELLAEAVRTWGGAPGTAVIATKGGITRQAGPDGDIWGRAGRPEQLLAAAQASAARLGVESIDLYFLHRMDPEVPFDDQIGGLVGVRDAGVARRIGLSNVSSRQLRRALELVGGPDRGGIVAVQNEYSPRYRRDPGVLATCSASGIAFLAWSPLGGTAAASGMGQRYTAFAEVAHERGVAVQQVALAWLLALAPVVIPIPGSTRPATVASSAAAAAIELTHEEMSRLTATEPQDESVFPDDTPEPPM